MIAKLIRKSNQRIVSLEQAKSHLRITTAHEDFYINSLLDVVTTTLENELGVDLVDTDYIFHIYDKLKANEPVLFPNSPAFGVSCTIKNGYEETEWAAFTASDETITFSELPPDYTSIQVKYKKGYTDVADLPKDIVQAALLLLTDLYQFRGTIVIGKTVVHIQKTIERLLQPYRQVSFI